MEQPLRLNLGCGSDYRAGYIRLPHVDDIITRFSADPDTRNLFIYGDTRQSDIPGSPKSGHTLSSFSALARYCGFKVVKRAREDTNFVFELEKVPHPSRLKSLVFINQTLGRGGAESFNQGLLKWLAGQGVSVSAWTTNRSFATRLISAGVSTARIPLVVDLIGDWKGLIKGLFLLPFAFFYYGWLVYRSRFTDIILMTGFVEKILVAPWAVLFSLPVVWIEFAPLQTVFSKFFSLPRLLYRLVSWSPRYLISPSHHTVSSNIHLVGVSAARTEIIPCALNLTFSPPKHLNPNSRLVCCVSRLELGKGQDLLISAWPQVLKSVPDAKLRLVGEGSQFLNLKSQISISKRPSPSPAGSKAPSLK